MRTVDQLDETAFTEPKSVCKSQQNAVMESLELPPFEGETAGLLLTEEDRLRQATQAKPTDAATPVTSGKEGVNPSGVEGEAALKGSQEERARQRGAKPPPDSESPSREGDEKARRQP